MLWQSLTNKRFIKDVNNETEIDFLDQTFDNRVKMRLRDVIEITQDLIGHRCWDKLSARYYNDSSYADLLYLFNEYSNPFSVEVGDIIQIPYLEDLQRSVVKDNSTNKFIEYDNIPINAVNKTINSNRETFLRKKDNFLPPTFTTKESIRFNQDGTITLAE